MTPQELEKFIHTNLRGLPLRQAPHSLQSRVMAVIHQRAMFPWYRTSWSEWPMAIRLPFLVLSTAIAATVMMLFYLMFNGIEVSAAASRMSVGMGLLVETYKVWKWSTDFTANIVEGIPRIWLYGGQLLVFAACTTFFGLCAVYYCTLNHNNWKLLPNEN